MYDYTRWPNFSKAKLICQETGMENPNVKQFTNLMDSIQSLRSWYGKPMFVNSAYRSPEHRLEARKAKPGQHSIAAIDFRVPTADCHKLVAQAFKLGYTGVGINLTGSASSRFIHLDQRESAPRIWSY